MFLISFLYILRPMHLTFWLNINGWLVVSLFSRLSTTKYECLNFEDFWGTKKEERKSYKKINTESYQFGLFE